MEVASARYVRTQHQRRSAVERAHSAVARYVARTQRERSVTALWLDQYLILTHFEPLDEFWTDQNAPTHLNPTLSLI